MKKTIIVLLFLFFFYQGKAQLVNSWGLTAGVSYCNQKFYFQQPQETLKKKYLFGGNGSLFLEFLNYDYIRWVSELQYNQKGAQEKINDEKIKNRLHYACFNNYLKIRKELFSIVPYILIGPRVEYRVAQQTQSPPIVGDFNPLHYSAAFGVGNEFVAYGSVSFFVEAFYNPDIKIEAYKTDPLNIKHNNFELRVGLKFLTGGGRPKACNVPRA